MNIVYIKLMTGEEILAEEVSENTFKNCIQIHFVPQQESGQVGLQMIPWPIGIDENTELPMNPNGIMMNIPAPVEMKNIYNQRFGSGIQVVKNPGILHG